jgi:Hsp20/alpha crystallin family
LEDTDGCPDTYLTIEAEKTQAIREGGVMYLRKERKYGKRSRSILLPINCNLDMIQSNFQDNGVLCIEIPKVAAATVDDNSFVIIENTNVENTTIEATIDRETQSEPQLSEEAIVTPPDKSPATPPGTKKIIVGE